jgi:tetratricopeptide (TPR) repeat protein
VATRGWRGRLRAETARSRQATTAVEQALEARQREAAQQRALEAAIAAHPDDVPSRLELARLRWAAAGPGAAAAVLAPIAGRTSDAGVLRMLTGAQRLMGREDLALATLDRAVAVVANPGDFQAERALLFTLMGWTPQARAALEQAVKQGADPLLTTLVRATMARQQGDFRQARHLLQQAQPRFPSSPELVRQLAAVEEAEGRIPEALKLLEAIEGSEAGAELQVTRGKLYLRLPGPIGLLHAREAAMRALAMRPQYLQARALLGRCQRRSGERQEARATLESLYRESPQTAGVTFELAQLYRDLGMMKEAAPLLTAYQQDLQRREVLRKATLDVMAQPDNAQSNLRMGLLCLDRGLLGRAILSLERAKRLDPSLQGVDALLARARAAPASAAPAEE